jgi:DNA-binding MarR family transcriptional regulator
MGDMKYEVQECIGARLRGLSRQVDSIYRKHLEGTNITENQLSIMLALYKTGEIEQIEIGRILNLERSSLSRNLTRLIDQQLVVKNGAVNRPVITLTSTGLIKVKDILPNWQLAMEEIHAIVDEKAYAGFNTFEKAIKRKE